jgi:hypothetical protein
MFIYIYINIHIYRWPPTLVKALGMFLNREIPDKIKGVAGTPLAPVKIAPGTPSF